MANKSSVIKAIDNSVNELEYVVAEFENLQANEDGTIDKSYVEKYLQDVKGAIEDIKTEFEEYDSEISDIEDDLGGLYKRLTEVIV